MQADIFEPGRSAKYRALIARARATNKHRDEIDKEAGFAAPGDTTDAMLLRNSISAITCGLEMVDWDCVAEGLDMLQVAEARFRDVKLNA